MNEDQKGCVLLVCVYNRQGNIITHDYLYEIFSPFGEIVKILIFEKAKVWKTFVQFKSAASAGCALTSLNNKVIFEDGSKMNIFPSKFRSVEFQNSNLGGVNYELLKESEQRDCFINEKKRRSTFQGISPQPYLPIPILSDNDQKAHSYQMESTSAKHNSGTISMGHSLGGSVTNLSDIDGQFRQIALQSDEFRNWEKQLKQINRKKSKTIVTNPNYQQFVLQNKPSKVLFIRSIPYMYNSQCLYNIFVSFGLITKLIHIKAKMNALIEYSNVAEAITAKDQLNYAKSQMKIFYSHYETLTLRKSSQDEEQFNYSQTQSPKKGSVNPPSETLYLTMVKPDMEEQLLNEFRKHEIMPRALEWRPNGKKWMCLAQFGSLQESLLILGLMLDIPLSNGKQLKISFTRSKINKTTIKNEQ